MTRPEDHEAWCQSWGYEGCSCDLEARQAWWDRSYRQTNAVTLPVARVVSRKKVSGRGAR